MKRLLMIAFVLGGAALIPLAAQAQRGMGARGGAGFSRGAGFARPAGRVGAVSAARPMGMRFSPASRRLVAGQRAFLPRNRFVRGNRFGLNGRFRHGFCAFGDCDRDDFFFRHHRFFNNFNNCFNTFGTAFGCSNPFLTGGFGFPFFDPFFDSSFSSEWQQPQQQPVVVENSNDNGNRELAFEVQSLRDEIQAMHDEDAARNQARNAPAPRTSSQPESPNAVLIFRDGRQLSAQNYAIADHTIWVLSPNSARKFPVADLDVSATEQANAKNGVEFHLPR